MQQYETGPTASLKVGSRASGILKQTAHDCRNGTYRDRTKLWGKGRDIEEGERGGHAGYWWRVIFCPSPVAFRAATSTARVGSLVSCTRVGNVSKAGGVILYVESKNFVAKTFLMSIRRSRQAIESGREKHEHYIVVNEGGMKLEAGITDGESTVKQLERITMARSPTLLRRVEQATIKYLQPSLK